jgi:leucyl/phenylalanyl-tRNA--protein transferase
VPIAPPPSRWSFPPATSAGPSEVVGIGADLEPGTVLAAYRAGIFPMPVDSRHLGWWSPDPRGIIPLDGLQVSRSLRRACRRFEIRIDTSFRAVAEACAAPGRPGAWITKPILDAYTELHRLGWAHSVEAWAGDGLAGGLYGVAIGGLFAGESMFHRDTDASKVALVALVELLGKGSGRLLDVQWVTSHLASLGAVAISRLEYLTRLQEALLLPSPPAFAGA